MPPKARHSTDAILGLKKRGGTAFDRRWHGIRLTEARHSTDKVTAFG